MHSPQEVISKFDLHETYRLYKVFLESWEKNRVRGYTNDI
jgi:aspartyl aminopeptidase